MEDTNDSTAAAFGYHFRGDASQPVITNGVFTSFTVMRRRQLSSRSQTYADCFQKLPDAASAASLSVQCLLPHCQNRTVKMAVKPSGGLIFTNFMSHMAKYHLGEVTPEDLSAALALGTTNKKGAGGQLSVGTMLSANADEKILQVKVRNAAKQVRVKEMLIEMVLHGNQPFSVCQNVGMRRSMSIALQEDANDRLKFPSVRTLVRWIDGALDAEEAAEKRRVLVLLRAAQSEDYYLRILSGTEDGWTRAGNKGVTVYTWQREPELEPERQKSANHLQLQRVK